METQLSQPPETVDSVPKLVDEVSEASDELLKAESSENVEQLAQPQSEPDESKEIIEQELKKQFRCIMHGFNPDDPRLQSDLNDLLAQILEKHHFVSPDERKHLQWRFESLIANGIPDSPVFREGLQALYDILWPAANANL